jgi:AraC-like DNA-binding protein
MSATRLRRAECCPASRDVDTPQASFHTVLPQASLRPYVSHYWLSRHNREARHAVLPDGALDLVLEIDGPHCQAHVFGTTTTRYELALRRGGHYLGLRFRPGQSRHFLRAAAAELTDTHAAAAGLLAFDLQDLPEQAAADGEVFGRLDTLLARHLHTHAPAQTGLDEAIRAIERAGGALPVTAVAALQGKSLRQFERDFRVTVGVLPKLFGRIQRFQRACDLVSGAALPLADIAADLGYTDQSHMSHEFLRFTGQPPAAWARRPVDFLQDR